MSGGRTTLRVVASPADTLAKALSDVATGDGWEVERRTHAEAALGTTIEVRGAEARVWPDAALVLRPPLEAPPDDADDLFLSGERLALLWAAAALSARPVLNRPTRRGLWSGGTPSARVTESRVGVRGGRPEVFCSDPGRRDWPGVWAAQRRDGTVGPWPRPGVGPVRTRPIENGEQYEAVTVVGSRTWRRSDEPLLHLCLHERSVAAARGIDLDFAMVWWAIPPALDRATLVRIVPAPPLVDVGPHWPEVGPALLALLS